MKAKELAEKLLENPDFEVRGIYADTSKCNTWNLWPEYHTFIVDGIADIGYSAKEILLDLSEV